MRNRSKREAVIASKACRPVLRWRSAGLRLGREQRAVTAELPLPDATTPGRTGSGLRVWDLKNRECVCVLVSHACLSLCDSVDCSPPASLSMAFSRRECWGE